MSIESLWVSGKLSSIFKCKQWAKSSSNVIKYTNCTLSKHTKEIDKNKEKRQSVQAWSFFKTVSF